MKASKLIKKLGNIDIYLLDQILKNRYSSDQTILDAGCGNGRNMHWFYHNNFKLFAIDSNEEMIAYIKSIYPGQKDNFQVASLDHLPYLDNSIDHIINSAVLHFSESTEAFRSNFAELIRVLKPDGTLFIRMTSNIGIENKITHLQDGVYKLGDESNRFLLSRKLMNTLLQEFPIEFLEPLKSTNVSDLRSMSTIMLRKL